MRPTHLPHSLPVGDLLTPHKLNENLAHVSRLIEQENDKRYCYSVVRIPFHYKAGQTMLHSDAAGLRTVYLKQNYARLGTVVGGYLDFYGRGVDTVHIDLVTTAGTQTVASWITLTPNAVTDTRVVAYGGDALEYFGSAQTFGFRIRGSDFQSKFTWLTLFLKTDRWMVPTEKSVYYTPTTIFNDNTALDVDLVYDEYLDIVSSVNAIETYSRYARCEIHLWHDLTSASTQAERQVTIPTINSSITHREIYSIYWRIELASAAASNNTWSLSLLDENGATQSTGNVSVLIGQSSGNGTITVEKSLAKALYNSYDTADDWALLLTHSAGTDAIKRVYAVITYY